jgi:hypothetical protein
VWVLALAVCFWATVPGHAGQSGGGSISGLTTSQGGRTLLPGAHVRLFEASSGKLVAETDSNASGAFLFPTVAPGEYRLRAHLHEFEDAESPLVRVRAGDKASISLDLAVAAFSETVIVRPRDAGSTIETSPTEMPLQLAPIFSLGVVSGASVSGALALHPGVILDQSGVISINGGRPAQAHVDIDGASVIDPAVGGGDLGVPPEAIDSVEVRPNPTSVDSGRLTAGLVAIHTKLVPDRLRFSIANFVPEPRFRNNAIDGIRDFSPRIFLGGPLIPRRLFVAESLLGGYENLRVAGLLDVKDTTRRYRLGDFTRLDAPVGSNLLRVGVAVSSTRTDRLDLARFVPPEATANLRDTSYQISTNFSSKVGESIILDSTLSVRSARVHIAGGGTSDMFVSPAGRSGTYFNDQERQSSTVQWKELLARESSTRAGHHTLKVGFDVLRGAYTGTSTSRPVDVLREDGSLAKRVAFLGPSHQSVQGTDGALFVGDTWKPSPRVRLESTMRLERDGVFGRTNLAPRIAAAFGLKEDGSVAIRGAIGIFHERPPLAAVAFPSFESFTIARFSADGTPLGPARRFTETITEPLRTPSSTIWNVAYDHNVSPHLSLSATFLERKGSNELLVRPQEFGPEAGRILLDSSGRSVYREAAIWAKYKREPVQLSVSYVRAAARGDLNSADSFIGSLRDPFVRLNQYGPTSRDMLNRIIGWVAVPFVWHTTLSLVAEWRTGAPFSAIDETWDYVGARNSRRFPAYKTVHVSVARDVHLAGQRVRIYVRLYQALNLFNPVEVQNNITSPAFGTFYSTLTRRFAIDFDLLR